MTEVKGQDRRYCPVLVRPTLVDAAMWGFLRQPLVQPAAPKRAFLLATIKPNHGLY